MEHGIVPRPRFTRCPPAFCAPTQHGRTLTPEELAALREHQHQLDAKRRATSERMSRIQHERWGT